MGYILNEEQQAVVELARDFATKEVMPLSASFDKSGELPMELYKKAIDLGFSALDIPAQYGGLGLDYYTISAVYEELARADAGFVTGLAATALALKPVLMHGSDEQKKYFADFICGDKGTGFASFALTEPGAGSDVSAGKTTAKKDGNEYVINGSKCFITNGGVAGIYVVFAITEEGKGAKGYSAFIVERDREGISIGKEEDKMGIRLSNTVELSFNDVRVPEDHILGEKGKGFDYALNALDLARANVGAFSAGIIQRCIDECVTYGKQRTTFGKPIIKHQVNAFKIADMDIMAETTRAAVINCFNNYYAGLPYRREAAIAKCHGGDCAVKCALEAIQILGGYGYSREYPVEKLLRDAKIMQIYDGTNEVQRMVISGYVCK